MKPSRGIVSPRLGRALSSALIGFALLCHFGCATTTSRLASRALHEGDYERAVRLLATLALEKPDNAKLWGRLGEAQYKGESYEEAGESFARALELDPDLVTAHLYLGYIAETDGDVDAALDHYQTFIDLRKRGKTTEDVTRRLHTLRRRRAEEFAQAALASERNLQPSGYSDSTVGVVYFNSERLSESLRPLVRGLGSMMVTDLSIVKGLTVVERLRTDELMKELSLSRTAAFDTSTAPRLGKLMGAAHVLGGDASELSHGRLRFDPQMVSTKTGDVRLTREQIGDLAEFFRMEKQMVFDLVDELGFTLTQAERDSIARIPTESFVAFLAYSRGLDLQDRGMYKDAEAEFERAADLDPNFQEARSRARETASLSDLSPDEAPVDVREFSQNQTGGQEWRAPMVRTDQGLTHQLDMIGRRRPAGDKTETDNPYTPATGGATVNIRGVFDEKP